MRFAYVTKTLINEFWQDVAAGIKSESGKYDIKFDAQAAKDESSLVEQLNLAQTILSQKAGRALALAAVRLKPGPGRFRTPRRAIFPPS